MSTVADQPIAVLGAGAFGTALAIQLARRGAPALLWGCDTAAMTQAQASHENSRYLPQCPLAARLTASGDFDATVAAAGDLLIATPMHGATASRCRWVSPLPQCSPAK